MSRNYKIKPLLLSLLFAAAMAQAQDYPFVNREANRMHGDSCSATFAHFARKWQQLTRKHQGNINIVHIGSSHVQAGTLPHRIRMNMLEKSGTAPGPRGLIFPYSAAAKCNNPADYRVHCVEKVDLCRNVYKQPVAQLGLCGIAVTAHDTLTTIQIVRNEYQADFQVDNVTVMGYSPSGVVPELDIDGRLTHPAIIDTISRRYHFPLAHSVDSFSIILPCDTLQTFTLTGIYLGNLRPGLSYHSIGVNGAALDDYLRCPYLTRDLRMLKPDMVIFGIGINDAAAPDFDTVVFYNRYRALVDSVRSVNPQCAIVFFTNNDSFKREGRGRKRHYVVNRNGLLARNVFYRLARDTDGMVWDQFEVMGGLSSMKTWKEAKLAQNDRVHFTRAGYKLLADLFTDALTRALDKRNNQ